MRKLEGLLTPVLSVVLALQLVPVAPITAYADDAAMVLDDVAAADYEDEALEETSEDEALPILSENESEEEVEAEEGVDFESDCQAPEMDVLDEPTSEAPELPARARAGREPRDFEGDSFRYQNGQLIPPTESVEDGLSAMAQFTMWTKNEDGIYVSSNGEPIEGALRRGVDVSEFNTDTENPHINWEKAQANDVSFAIIRCGFTGWGSKKQFIDDEFLYNATECERLGIPYGVYFYSSAENVYQAWQEANYVINLLKGRKLSMPVYYDLEWEGVGSASNCTLLANMSKVFCNAIEAAGFEAGVYANLTWWNNYLTDECFDDWERWVAQYYSTCEYEGEYRMWQSTSVAKVDGIGSTVDLNFDWEDGSRDMVVTGTGSNPLQYMICPNPPDTLVASSSKPTVMYRAHVQNIGWQESASNGDTAGTSGKSLRVEALQVDVGGIDGGITYRTHVQNVGWMPWASDGKVSGTSDMSYRVEAVEMKLTGGAANSYNIWYRAHVQNVGWQDWVSNGATAGTSGKSLRVEAIEILLLPKGQNPNGTPVVTYDAHVQNIGWQDEVTDGATAGTSGRSLRVEATHITLSGVRGGITYRTHVQNVGWQGWVSDGALAGTTGRSLRLEAIEIKLTGTAASQYDVWYRAHIQNIGWQPWVSNGAMAGTSGRSLRMEAVQVAVTPKGSGAPSV